MNKYGYSWFLWKPIAHLFYFVAQEPVMILFEIATIYAYKQLIRNASAAMTDVIRDVSPVIINKK